MTIFAGYSGNIWAQAFAALDYYSTQLGAAAAAGNPALAATVSESTLLTMMNGVAAIDANAMTIAWGAEATSMAEILALPLAVTPQQGAAFLTRFQTYVSAVTAVSGIVPYPPFGDAATLLGMNQAAIPDPGLLEFLGAFNYEAAPAGLSAANFISTATNFASLLAGVASAIQVFQGAFPNQLYDVANRIAQTAGYAAGLVSSLTSGPVASGTAYTWNQMAVVPQMTTDSDLLSTPPYILAIQQSIVIRNAMLTSAFQIALFLLILRQPGTAQVNLTQLRQDENLMDVAARTLGNYELWTQIAQINNLFPPYVSSTPGSGVAIPGQQIVLPSPGSSTSSIGTAPSYETNFLGTDLDFGPINGSMPTWNGDFQIITGYKNLARALGRRLQTTLTALIYHRNYGSRIPPEVGAVQDTTTAGHIANYGKSAIRSDSRVASVLQAVATLVVPNEIDFRSTVQPAGAGTTSISVNEVIQPIA